MVVKAHAALRPSADRGGFCGTTTDFCGDGCQSGCEPTSRPTCPENTDAMHLSRRVAYYELMALYRTCNQMAPEQIPAGALTHVNLAFQTMGSDYKITDVSGDIVARVSRLKKLHPHLRVNVAIGGWDSYDPSAANTFADMTHSIDNRQIFIQSVIVYLQKYGLDGVDIDWEYPGVVDRGGLLGDDDTYVLLLSDMRDAFDKINPGWEISITLPSSYGLLREFNLSNLAKFVAYFNFMAYDINGMWDQNHPLLNDRISGHTNISEIDKGLDVLWRNNIDPKQVVMGISFYGRSYTLADDGCSTPNGDCRFSTSGVPGTCSASAGMLLYGEIISGNGTLNSETFYDSISTVKYNVFDGTQWVSYDDEQSFMDKKRVLSSRCIGGLGIWAIDHDDAQYNALNGLLGDGAMKGTLFQGAYTGQNCFVTRLCTDGTKANSGPDQVCPVGTTSITTAHAPYQAVEMPLQGDCGDGWYRHICCPTSAMPQNCQWNGEPLRSATDCSGKCGDNQFALNTDPFTDPHGQQACVRGHRTLCCDSTDILDDCFWTPCQGPISDLPQCPSDTTFLTYRYDDGNGQFCSQSEAESPIEESFKQAFCCPTIDTPNNCSWSNDPRTPQDQIVQSDPEFACQPHKCDKTQVQYTSALDPPNSSLLLSTTTNGNIADCAAYPLSPGQNPSFPFCCNPPQAYNDRWPVDPKYLWANGEYHNGPGDDVIWAYADNYGNDLLRNSPSDTIGDDPYGFVMLNGPPGSLDDDFSKDYTVASETQETSRSSKRSLLTSNRTVLDSVFEHSEEIVYVYCNHPKGSRRCDNVFHKGVTDTIIRLPTHIGEGPFARILSMEPALGHQLPSHHLRTRSITRNTNPVYRLHFDYNFHLIKREEPVNMRVDYTNLMSYWQNITNRPDSKKRSVLSHDLPYGDWRATIREARSQHRAIRKRQQEISPPLASHIMKRDPSGLSRRWFGAFVDWLSNLATLESSNIGYLSMGWKNSMLLYHAVKGCQKSTAYAELSMYLDSDISMDMTYAYYFSGQIAPVPKITGTYAYVGIEPSAYLGLRVEGLAKLQYASERVKLVDTLSWPGLAIKGIAAVGPTLDVFGQLKSTVVLSGQMQVGVRFSFEKQEWYWPDDEHSSEYNALVGLDSDPEPVKQGITPEFSASVSAVADIDVLVTPEASLGIQVGMPGLGGTLVNAQIVGYVNSTLNLHAEAHGSIDISGEQLSTYKYGAYLKYNVGYGGRAKIPLFPWYIKSKELFDAPAVIPLYESPPQGIAAKTIPIKRDEIPADPIKFPRRGLLNKAAAVDIETPDMNRARKRADGSETSPANASMAIDQMFRRQIDPDGDPTGSKPEFSLSQLFDCPENDACKCDCDTSAPSETVKRAVTRAKAAAQTCGSTLPDLRVNCKVFGDAKLSSTKFPKKKKMVVPGICTGQQDYFRRRSLPNTGYVLTFDPNVVPKLDSKRIDARRNFACKRINKKGFCSQVNEGYQAFTGFERLSSCDEFPYASSEEGGDFTSTDPLRPIRLSSTCVPAWQQTIQGNCIGLLRSLSTNVKHADEQNRKDKTIPPEELWKRWDDPDWVQGVGPGRWQRLAVYPNRIPIQPGLTSTVKNMGYMFKRNYTYGLSYPSGRTDGAAWGDQAFTSWSSKKGKIASDVDATQVLCAVNIFGQKDIYRYNKANGYCFTKDPPKPTAGFAAQRGWRQCQVSFTNSPGPTKRSLGTLGDWHIEDIQMDENEEPLGYIPLSAIEPDESHEGAPTE
ncbi:glycoside hydrolase family 18 protein [Aulographum hederae CBS 113979]|uniref:chitinase n=1 Tax=Aulographum hederae CBS 113979 TaxID=1176131 RepID=A0A6G1HG91_9PEZI|nr:glycoside hydrolase family 18 protein [Aulographum hederae CBS 113979]